MAPSLRNPHPDQTGFIVGWVCSISLFITGLPLWRVFDVTEQAAIALAAAAGFPGSVLSFGSATSWTFYHVAIFAQF